MAFHRIVPLLLLLVGTSSCAVMYELMVPAQKRSSQESRRVEELTGAAWKAKDCQAGVDQLKSVADKARVRSALGGAVTAYGTEVKRWWLLCAQQGAAATHATEGDPLLRYERAVRLMDLALSLPVAELALVDKHPEGDDTLAKAKEVSVARVASLRAGYVEQVAKLTAERAVQRTEAERRVALARAAEAKGWHLAALAVWHEVAPVDGAGHAQRQEALGRLAPLARSQLAVPVAVVPAPGGGASAELVTAVRADAALRARPDLQLVDDPAAATVVMHLAVGAFANQRRQESVRQQHT